MHFTTPPRWSTPSCARSAPSGTTRSGRETSSSCSSNRAAIKPEYFEFQANPRMLVFEMAFPRRGGDPLAFKTAPPLGSKAVVALEGTLDHPGDRDSGWSVEGRIPWSAFATGGGKPNAGDEWLFALCRYDYGPDGTRPVLMSSAPLSQPKFHRYEDYGKLRFEGPRKSDSIAGVGDRAVLDLASGGRSFSVPRRRSALAARSAGPRAGNER